jgi:hypothetical protein
MSAFDHGSIARWGLKVLSACRKARIPIAQPFLSAAECVKPAGIACGLTGIYILLFGPLRLSCKHKCWLRSLAIGTHERLPRVEPALQPLAGVPQIFRRAGAPSAER